MLRAMRFLMLVGLLTGCGDAIDADVATGEAPAGKALRYIPGVEPPLPPLAEVFKGEPGCIVACYKQCDDGPTRWVGIPALLRVEGAYDQKHICVPSDAQGEDISRQDGKYSRLCMQEFPEICKDAACWAGGDTFPIATRLAREHKIF